MFKSTNGGSNWSAVNTGLTNTVVLALAIDPATPATLYAGTAWRRCIQKHERRRQLERDQYRPDHYRGYTPWRLTRRRQLPSMRGRAVEGYSPYSRSPPTLAINYTSGAPGSYFTVTGSQFPPNSTTTIAINGSILGTIPTDASGGLIFLLETSSTTDEGYYGVTTSTPYSTRTHFTLDQEDAVRPQEGSGTVFIVPDGIANRVLYLPRLVK